MVLLHSIIVGATDELGRILIKTCRFKVLLDALPISRADPVSSELAGRYGDGNHRQGYSGVGTLGTLTLLKPRGHAHNT